MESQRTVLYPRDRSAQDAADPFALREDPGSRPAAPRPRLLPREPRTPAGGQRPAARVPRVPAHGVEQESQRVLGRYRLVERLGAGGFGVVWRAEDELLHRQVALKHVWLGPGGDSERASREALAAARLSHPAIVALHEAVAVEGAFYLISELVEGHTLAQLLAGDGLADEDVLAIGCSLSRALAHAHARGVVHRDIKPQNVLVPADRRGGEAAKLTDFGGASLAGEDALTRTGDVLGTLAYMAPEQSEGRFVAAEADLYSFALVLYEAFGGVNPVRGRTPAETAKRIGSQLPPLARRRGDLPRALAAAIDAALAPAPERRGSLRELACALEEARTGSRRPAGAVEPAGESDAEPWRNGADGTRALLGRVPAWSVPAPAPREHAPTLAAPTRALPSHAPAPAPEPRRLPPLRRRRGGAEPDFEPVGFFHEEPQPRPAEPPPAAARVGLAMPRAAWIAGTLLLMGWQASLGRAGVALLLLAALAPLLVLASAYRAAGRWLGAEWLGCVVAPVLGLASLAGAYPALAGQLRGWRTRALAGALGYWWLTLCEPLLARRLWLGPHAGTPARSLWEASPAATVSHVIGPLLGSGLLLGALLWAAGAALLPWIVRGSHAAVDAVAVTVWSAALAACAAVFSPEMGAASSHGPRGAVIGALLGGLIALAARALRGPV